MKIPLLLTFAVAIPLLSGCGSSKAEYPAKVFPVTGQIMWQGQPVAGADVVFFNPDTNRSAFGRTDDSGKYKLTTFESNDGAVAGRQIVTVSKIEAITEAPFADMDSADYVPPETIQPKRGKKPEKPKSLIPEKYGAQSSSNLVVVVEETKKNVADLKLD